MLATLLVAVKLTLTGPTPPPAPPTPPAWPEWTILFDGTSLDAWKMSRRGSWTITTNRVFGDVQLHIQCASPTGGAKEESVPIIDATASELRLSELWVRPLGSYR